MSSVGPADWDRRFLRLARHISQWSKDPSTKVGCVIVGHDRQVLTTGYNGFPRGVADTEERLHDREQKYPRICHGEENAVIQAARIGVAINGCTAYVTGPPCSRCARMLIQAGIQRVVYPTDDWPPRWRAEIDMGASMFREARVSVSVYELPLTEPVGLVY